jgi:hypothetical protein
MGVLLEESEEEECGENQEFETFNLSKIVILV